MASPAPRPRFAGLKPGSAMSTPIARSLEWAMRLPLSNWRSVAYGRCRGQGEEHVHQLYRWRRHDHTCSGNASLGVPWWDSEECVPQLYLPVSDQQWLGPVWVTGWRFRTGSVCAVRNNCSFINAVDSTFDPRLTAGITANASAGVASLSGRLVAWSDAIATANGVYVNGAVPVATPPGIAIKAT